MSGAPAVVLLIAAAVGAGVASGALYVFSVMVMGALAGLPSPHAIAAMQTINERALTPPFLGVLMGTTLVCLAVAVIALVNLGDDGAPAALAGAALYLLGVMALTMTYHVPRNNALAALDPDAPEAVAQWQRYRVEWTRWNHARAAAGALAAAAFALALHLG